MSERGFALLTFLDYTFEWMLIDVCKIISFIDILWDEFTFDLSKIKFTFPIKICSILIPFRPMLTPFWDNTFLYPFT